MSAIVWRRPHSIGRVGAFDPQPVKVAPALPSTEVCDATRSIPEHEIVPDARTTPPDANAFSNGARVTR